MAQWSELAVMGVPGKTFQITTGTNDAAKTDNIEIGAEAPIPTQPRVVAREVTLFSGTYATGTTYYAVLELDADVSDIKLYTLSTDLDGPLTFDTTITETNPDSVFYASSSLVDWTPTQNVREMHAITSLSGVKFFRIGYVNNSGGTVTLSVVARYISYINEARLVLTGTV
jgi:hypothetical protein